MFDIANLLVQKMKKASQIEINTLLRHVNGLKSLPKFSLGSFTPEELEAEELKE